MFLEYLGISTGHDMLETIVLLIGAGITGYMLSEVMIYLWELRISLGSNLSIYRETIERRVALTRRFGERHAKITRNVEAVDEEIQTLISQQTDLTNKLRQIQDLQSRCVRTIGNPIKGAKCYRALVTNSYVKEYINSGNKHPVYDDSWARAQIVEVWSTSNSFALLALREKYPQAQGFTVDKIEPVQNEANLGE